MSNYYVSKCCDAQAKYISSGEEIATGQCTKCHEMSDLILIEDKDYRKVDLGGRYDPVNHDGFIQ